MRAVGALIVFSLVAGGGIVACSSFNSDATTVITQCIDIGNPPGCDTPTYAHFKGSKPGTNGVADMMIQRCGSLDCHGQVGRPLRLYGLDALRLPVDGGSPTPLGLQTSEAEYQADFAAVVGLQPEDTIRDVGTDAVLNLLLIEKPTGELVHKGGTVLVANPPDPGLLCLAYWLQNREPTQYIEPNCAAAIYPLQSFQQ